MAGRASPTLRRGLLDSTIEHSEAGDYRGGPMTTAPLPRQSDAPQPLSMLQRASAMLSRSKSAESMDDLERMAELETHFRPVDISTEGLSYAVKIPVPGARRWCPPTTEKKLVQPINLTLRAGEFIALMGPSGAGKTTLLNVLAGHNHHTGIVRGRLFINGELAPPNFKQMSCFIPQDDVLLAGLTPRESLYYVACLKLSGVSDAYIDRKVNEILQDLGLEECADALVGSVEKKGISGGQRKRTSIGLELITNPSVVFVDEATSGLDSKMAEDVIGLLGQLAKKGHLVICTIHQPSVRVFKLFERCVLMAKGRVCYDGRVDEAQQFFSQEYDLAVEEGDNPADAYMRWLQDPALLERMLDKARDLRTPYLKTRRRLSENGRPSVVGTEMPELAPGEDGKDDGEFDSRTVLSDDMSDLSHLDVEMSARYARSGFMQAVILTKRNFQDTTKDPEQFTKVIFIRLLLSLLLGTVWLGQGGDTQDSIQPVDGALFVAILNVFQDCAMTTVLAMPSRKSLILREYRNGYYCMPAWLAAYLVNTLFFQAIQALVFAVPLYYMIGLRQEGHAILIFCATLVLITWIAGAIGLIAGAVATDVKEAQAFIAPLLIPMLLFSGFLIPYDSIPSYFKFLYHASFMQYGFAILQINEYTDKIFSDCAPESVPDQCQDFVQCVETGEELLDHRHIAVGDLDRNFGLISVIWLVVTILAFYTITSKVRNA